MKKIFSIIVFLIVLCGCSESFLDRQPEDTLAPGIFFKTPADIKTGVVAVYQGLQSNFAVNSLPSLLGLMSDDGTIYDGSWDVVNTFYKTGANSAYSNWNGLYKMIVNANNIIDIIDKYKPLEGEEIVIKAYRGEACFLRAFSYFYLVRLYGDVPMVVKRFDDPGKAFGIGRTPVNDIYEKVIIPDLEYAFENCYKKGDAAIASEGARATRGAALTILGKVYLTMNNHAKAAETLKKLIVDNQAGTYSLLTDFSKIWLPSNKFNSESVFEVNYNRAAGSPSFYFRNMSMNTAWFTNNSMGLNMKTPNGQFTGEKNLMDEFVAYQELTRYKVSVDTGFTYGRDIIPFPLKLMPPIKEVNQYDLIGTDYNYMITRYADALLMYAEALMVLGQKDVAATYVNQVRARVNMAPVTGADLNIDRILHERRMELAFEGHRYFDLVRTGKAIEYISNVLINKNRYQQTQLRNDLIPAYQLLLPIPIGEIEKDQTLTQNPGY